MSWVTWRQHRLEGSWAAALTILLAAAVAFIAYQLNAANCPALVSGYCFNSDAAGQLARAMTGFNLAQYGLVVLPAFAGAFIGAPVVAREVENGTHRLAWTQGVTRLRWLTVKIVSIFTPLLVFAAAVGVLETVLVNHMGTHPNYWAYFDQQAPITVASTLFALSLGVAAGAVVQRSIPAMAVTLVAFCAVRIGIAELARPNYLAPVAFTTHDMATFSSPPQSQPGAWWVDQASMYDSAGHFLGTADSNYQGIAADAIQHFQPADRFWQFQTIESLILAALAIALIGFATYWVTRRIS